MFSAFSGALSSRATGRAENERIVSGRPSIPVGRKSLRVLAPVSSYVHAGRKMWPLAVFFFFLNGESESEAL